MIRASRRCQIRLMTDWLTVWLIEILHERIIRNDSRSVKRFSPCRLGRANGESQPTTTTAPSPFLVRRGSTERIAKAIVFTRHQNNRFLSPFNRLSLIGKRISLPHRAVLSGIGIPSYRKHSSCRFGRANSEAQPTTTTSPNPSLVRTGSTERIAKDQPSE